MGGIQKIFGPKTAAQRRKILCCAKGQPFRRGKRRRTVFQRVAEETAKAFDDAADAWDIIVLAEDKRAQSFPWVLAQQTDSRGEPNRPAQDRIGGKMTAQSGVILIQTKIGNPEFPDALAVCVGKNQNGALLPDSAEMSGGNAFPEAVGAEIPAKALSAIQRSA